MTHAPTDLDKAYKVATDAHQKAALVYAERQEELAKAEGVLARLQRAEAGARDAFDADPTKREAYVEAQAAARDARVDTERAARLSERAANEARDALDAKHAAHVAVLDAATSREAAHTMREPVVELIRAGVSKLLEALELDARLEVEFRARLEEFARVAGNPALAGSLDVGRYHNWVSVADFCQSLGRAAGETATPGGTILMGLGKCVSPARRALSRD